LFDLQTDAKKLTHKDFLVRVENQTDQDEIKGNRAVIPSRLAGAQRVSFALSSVIKARKFEDPIVARFLDATAGPAQGGGDPGGPAQI
jgi:hypothetical protein